MNELLRLHLHTAADRGRRWGPGEELKRAMKGEVNWIRRLTV
jgi:hypothetical protein